MALLYVAVAGNIGAGKTELTQYLSRRYGLQPLYEPHEQNPYLASFYGDMKAWAFHSQLSFLGAKLGLHRQLEAHPGRVVQDRTLYEDAEIFEQHLHRQGMISDRDHATYRALYEGVAGALRKPDLMLFLRCPVRTLLRRIARRGRDMERNIPPDYLRQLDALYEAWRGRYNLSPVVDIETGALDYMTDLVDRLEIQEALEPYLGPPRMGHDIPPSH